MSLDEELIEDFQRMPGAWLTQSHTGWWALYGDERPLGPFDTKAEAARAGLEAWAHVIKKRR